MSRVMKGSIAFRALILFMLVVFILFLDFLALVTQGHEPQRDMIPIR
jgi:hypothetical protein